MQFDSLLLYFVTIFTALTAFSIMLMSRSLRKYTLSFYMSDEIDRSIKSMVQAGKRSIEIDSVLAYLDNIQERPELMNNLEQFSRDALAASILQRISALSETILDLHAKLRKYENSAMDVYKREEHIKRLRAEINVLESDQIQLHKLAAELSALQLRSV